MDILQKRCGRAWGANLQSHYKIIWKKQAKRDLLRIWHNIYDISASAKSANKWLDKITLAGDGLDMFPIRNSKTLKRGGHIFWHIRVGKYYIYYEIIQPTMEINIVRVIETKADDCNVKL